MNDFPSGTGSIVEASDINSLVSQHPLYAVGSYDGNVRLISTRTWEVAFVLPATNPSEMSSVMQGGIATTVEIIAAENTSLGADPLESTMNRTIER